MGEMTRNIAYMLVKIILFVVFSIRRIFLFIIKTLFTASSSAFQKLITGFILFGFVYLFRSQIMTLIKMVLPL